MKPIVWSLVFGCVAPACAHEADAGVETGADSVSATDTEAGTEVESESETESETESDIETESEVESDIETESETEVDIETESEVDIETEAETEVETDTDTPGDPTVRAFPGAEGFGRDTTGGRGGSLCAVTSLASSGAGTLRACLQAPGARVVVFRVSGVIDAQDDPLEIPHGDLTIAGQTSPGGITLLGGLVCDNVYDDDGADCDNVIIRHLRVRRGNPDSIRIGGSHAVILDHVSLGGANDETIELTRSHDITIQNTLIAEPVGDHYQWGGVLINYSTSAMPQDRMTLHHNLWNGVFGRLPEISCEENGDAPGSNCAGHTTHLELTSNLLFDVAMPTWYNRCVGNNAGNDCPIAADNFKVDLNWVDNYSLRRTGVDTPMLTNDIALAANHIFYRGNRVRNGSDEATATIDTASIAARHDFPAVTATPAAALIAYMKANVGAFPRDPMDRRLIAYLDGTVDQRPVAWQNESGLDRGDQSAVDPNPPAPPADGDGDGMPDAWESAHGLDPHTFAPWATTLADGGGAGLADCTLGYTDLDCYLAWLSLERIQGR